MARSIVIEYVDDLDGTRGPDVAPMEFALDGIRYDIDLGPHNAATLRATFEPFRKVARRRPRRPDDRMPQATPLAESEAIKTIRDWAREHGYEVATRGRLSTTVMSAYEEAHGRPDMPPLNDDVLDGVSGTLDSEYPCWTPRTS
jgi:hypothetical protein